MNSLFSSFSSLKLSTTSNRSTLLSRCFPSSTSTSTSSSSSSIFSQQIRHRSQLAPRRVKYRKSHKGRIPFPTGGSLKGTTIQQGVYGIRLLAPARLSARQLQSAEVALKRKLKVVKGAQVYMRVFPDIPVCVKGNETRMGKGKGAFEFWACRAPIGRVIFEVGGPVEIRLEVAKEALRLASAKLPVPTEFISLTTQPRLGHILSTELPRNSVVQSAAVEGVTAGEGGRAQ